MNQDLTLKVGFDIDKFQKELSKTNGMLSKWSAGVQQSLMGVAAGFSAMAVGQFALDVSKLAGEAEGVRAAFEKLPRATQLMLDLKAATSGTVSELDLMKRAVLANNFEIDLQALPKLLEFAAIRAKQTGQSVDFLVESLVTGLGRKSLLILDNLGISATRLKEKFNGAALEAQSIADVTKAVGEIASEELQKMGTMSENASTKIERLSASWTNLKVALGDAANGTGIMGTAIDALNMQMQIFASNNLSLIDKLIALANPVYAASAAAEDLGKTMGKANEEAKKQAQVVKEVDRAMASGNAKAYIEAQKQHVYYNEILAEYNKRITATEQQKTQAIKATTKAIEDNSAAILKRANATGGSLTGGGNIADLVKVPTSISSGMRSLQMPVIDLQANLEKLGLVAIDVGAIMQQSLTQGIVSVAEAIGDAVSGVANFGDNILKAFGQLAKQVGSIVVGLGVAALATKKFLIANPVAAIAAGTALIALGQIAQNSISRAASNMGAGGAGGGSGRNISEGTRFESLGQRVEITGKIVADGKQLAVVLTNQTRSDGRRKAS